MKCIFPSQDRLQFLTRTFKAGDVLWREGVETNRDTQGVEANRDTQGVQVEVNADTQGVEANGDSQTDCDQG